MPPFRTLLIICLTIVAASAIASGALLVREGVSSAEAVGLTVSLLIAQLIPWTAAFIWISRRTSDLHYLIKRTERVVEGEDDTFSGRQYTQDLDELLRASEELRSTLARERSSLAEHRAAIDQLVESLGEGVLAVGREGHVVFANSRFAQMFGAPERLVGLTVAEVVRRHSVIAALDRALHGTASVDRITVGAADKGRQIEIRAFPVSSSSEIAAAALFIDITEIERLQSIRSEFIEDFSHEVRTPLAGLRTAVETLEPGGVTREHEYELRQVMLRQLTRLERLVKDLSELHRIESGELVLDRRPVDVRNVLSDLCKDFQERVAGQSVSFKLTGDEARANADPVRLQQVFSNLLDNAWKHGGEGEVLVEVGRDKGDAVVKISDEGEGIPPGEAERIFNRFYRVDRSRSQKVPGGAGLGLAIAKHLVLLHGGAIRAYNRAGGGATFEVRLPTV